MDVPSDRVVTNDFPQITIDMAVEWKAFRRAGASGLYPSALRPEIDAVNDAVYADVTNGVYRAGFAGSQKSYAQAYERLFARLARHRLTELPVLWAYARDLSQTPGFGDTVDFTHIKQHYYTVHSDINPTGIVPEEPDDSDWTAPHGRTESSGTGGRSRPSDRVPYCT
ncbi:hypothetical protein ACIRP0_07355 [Streptomyces sp. NPDC101733]|uniref:hypothetical protein n=1 Tax=unclassified Streptomyces TaxID=2593676 RepID=UPI003825D235